MDMRLVHFLIVFVILSEAKDLNSKDGVMEMKTSGGKALEIIRCAQNDKCGGRGEHCSPALFVVSGAIP